MKDFYVRRGAHWIVMSLFLTVAACGGDSVTNAGDDTGNDTGNGNGNDTDPVATTAVDVDDNSFAPPDILVGRGFAVTWTWVGDGTHNVTFASTVSAPSATQTSGSFQVTMPMAVGVYNYTCTIHGFSGSVTVQ